MVIVRARSLGLANGNFTGSERRRNFTSLRNHYAKRATMNGNSTVLEHKEGGKEQERSHCHSW